MYRIAIIISVVLLLGSCNRDSLTPEPDAAVALTYTDAEYGTHPQQKMDIFLPAGRKIGATKTMVVIHGGSWVNGDKSEMAFVVDSLKRRLPAYAFVNLNYRLAVNSTVNLFPVQEADVKTAIESYLLKSSFYGISKDVVLLGGSAGAHLALLHGYKNDPDKHVKAVIDFFGPVNLVSLWDEGFFQQLALTAVTGKSYAQDPAIYIQSSPINFINAQSPPTIALQGGLDNIVLPTQTNLLIEKLNANGVINQLVFYPNEGHGFTTASNTDALIRSISFISKYVK